MTINDAENSFTLAHREISNLAELLMVLELAALEQERNKKASFEWSALVEVTQRQLAAVMPLLNPVEAYLTQEWQDQRKGKGNQPDAGVGRVVA